MKPPYLQRAACANAKPAPARRQRPVLFAMRARFMKECCHCERSEAISFGLLMRGDCFVATLFAMTRIGS
jgi:hypothetical protein